MCTWKLYTSSTFNRICLLCEIKEPNETRCDISGFTDTFKANVMNYRPVNYVFTKCDFVTRCDLFQWQFGKRMDLHDVNHSQITK